MMGANGWFTRCYLTYKKIQKSQAKSQAAHIVCRAAINYNYNYNYCKKVCEIDVVDAISVELPSRGPRFLMIARAEACNPFRSFLFWYWKYKLR